MTRVRAGWVVFGLVIAVAIGRALTANDPASGWRADEATRRSTFRFFAATEASERAQAARAFPGDPWSADDDFHNHEQGAAWEIAAQRRVGVADVLRAIDEGLRDPSQTAGRPLIATVPPCHPRPVY